MASPSAVYWPFPVLPSEKRTEQHWKEIRFFETAYQEGFKPCECATGEYKAVSDQQREGLILYRGRQRREGSQQWEVWLDDVAIGVVKFWANDFEAAAESVLRWLRGQDLAESLDSVQRYLVKNPQLYPSLKEVTQATDLSP